jgi:hypothetical protein
MVGVPIKNVLQATYVKWLGEVSPEPPAQPQKQEVLEFYFGVIALNSENGAPLLRPVFRTFIPTNTNRIIRAYQSDLGFHATVSVAPATYSVKPDDMSLVGVDVARITVEPNRFPGIGGRPEVLVLTMETAILRGNLLRVAYNVVVSSVFEYRPDPENPEGPPQPFIETLEPIPASSVPGG